MPELVTKAVMPVAKAALTSVPAVYSGQISGGGDQKQVVARNGQRCGPAQPGNQRGVPEPEYSAIVPSVELTKICSARATVVPASAMAAQTSGPERDNRFHERSIGNPNAFPARTFCGCRSESGWMRVITPQAAA